MRNKFEHILLSVLLGIAVLLGLSFWLNIIYGFNLFSREHWNELAKLQADQIPVSTGFYISIGIAVFIFVFGLLVLYIPAINKCIHKKESTKLTKKTESVLQAPSEQKNYTKQEEPTPTLGTRVNLNLSRPPKLNLPANMTRILQQQHQEILKKSEDLSTQYDSILEKIFTKHGYVVKPNPIISKFKPNLFAIGPNEIVWIGAINTDIAKLQSAITRLKSIFTETLEDIQININAFIIDTKNTQNTTDSVFIFKSIEELENFVSELPPIWPKDMSDTDQDNFDAYSEYIDTVIKYIKNLG